MRAFFKKVRRHEFDENETDINMWKEFSLIIYNPASVSSKDGIRILQQITSLQKSTIKTKCFFLSDISSNRSCYCSLESTNVRRIQIALNRLYTFVNDFDKTSTTIQVDHSKFETVSVADTILELCLVSEISYSWQRCSDSGTYDLYQRSPLTYGPIRQAFEQPFRIVYGTTGTEEMKNQYMDWALYLANTWYMTGDVTAEILSDQDVIIYDQNILLLGDERSNRWTNHFMQSNKDRIDFKLSSGYVQLGPCVFSGQVGFMSLFPIIHETRTTLGVLVGGTTLRSMFDVIMLSKPTIPPMTRQPFSNTFPDFIVTGKETHSKGVGGYLAAGFWGYDWKYDQKSSYVSYCKPEPDSQTVDEIQKHKNIITRKDEL